MNKRVLAAVLALLLLASGFGLGRLTSSGPSPEYVASLEADNETLRQSVQRLSGQTGPGLVGVGEGEGQAAAALARLRRGSLSADETLALLAKVSADQARCLDLDVLLGPILESDGYKVVRLLGRLEPSPETLARLDQRLIRGVATGATTQAVLAHYLRYTGRYTWELARPLLEAGLEQSTQATRGVFLLAALDMAEGPDEAWVEWARKHYKFSDPVNVLLRRRGG